MICSQLFWFVSWQLTDLAGFAMVSTVIAGGQEVADPTTCVAAIAAILLMVTTQMLLNDNGRQLLGDYFVLASAILHTVCILLIFQPALRFF
jgi:hypothetical protein